MKISARNVLAGKVTNVTKGAVNSEVTLILQGGENMVAIITNSSVDTLGLRHDAATYAIIKASDVMIGKGNEMRLSARNVLAGEVAKLQDGAVNSEVEVRLAGGTAVVAAITKESVKALDLHQGDKVSAIIKASHVLLGV
jgi:molybdate transport system regulatory protein